MKPATILLTVEVGGVMKIKGDSISLISVIFILSAIMAMAGCAVPTPMSAEYRDPLTNIHIQSASPAYPNLVLAVLISENTKSTIEDGRQGRSWKTSEELEKMFEKENHIKERWIP
jgi:ABC-type uncharacterized transport system permease subunit